VRKEQSELSEYLVGKGGSQNSQRLVTKLYNTWYTLHECSID